MQLLTEIENLTIIDIGNGDQDLYIGTKYSIIEPLL